jgi:DNA-binding response OmpR family regulator
MIEPGCILLADDEETYRESTADLIRVRGHRCDCAPDGAVAARMLREVDYDLLIADLQMPGNEHLDLLHSLANLTDAPTVLIVTGYPSLDTAIESHQFDIVGYLVKPVDLDEFFDCVERGVCRTKRRRVLQGSHLRIQQLAKDLGQIERTSLEDGDAPVGAQVYLELTLANILGSLQELRRMASIPDGASREEQAAAHVHPGRQQRPVELEQAIRETIAVLERTKTAFKSKDLGELRHRLEAVLRYEEVLPHSGD